MESWKRAAFQFLITSQVQELRLIYKTSFNGSPLIVFAQLFQVTIQIASPLNSLKLHIQKRLMKQSKFFYIKTLCQKDGGSYKEGFKLNESRHLILYPVNKLQSSVVDVGGEGGFATQFLQYLRNYIYSVLSRKDLLIILLEILVFKVKAQSWKGVRHPRPPNPKVGFPSLCLMS